MIEIETVLNVRCEICGEIFLHHVSMNADMCKILADMRAIKIFINEKSKIVCWPCLSIIDNQRKEQKEGDA